MFMHTMFAYCRGLIERGTDNYIFHRGLQCAVLAKPWAETAPLFALKVLLQFINSTTILQCSDYWHVLRQ
jgi:hypothetical protein